MKTITALSLAGALAFAVPAMAQDGSSAPSIPSAQKQCRTERAQMGHATFRQTYGTNAKRTNAFGKCVSARRKATRVARADAHTNAAQQCAAERSADPAAFKDKWGNNHNGANAFGKCVSTTAKAQASTEVKTEVKAQVNAADSCRSERKADAAAFAQKYGSKRNAFGKCVSRTAAADEQSGDSGQQS